MIPHPKLTETQQFICYNLFRGGVSPNGWQTAVQDGNTAIKIFAKDPKFNGDTEQWTDGDNNGTIIQHTLPICALSYKTTTVTRNLYDAYYTLAKRHGVHIFMGRLHN